MLTQNKSPQRRKVAAYARVSIECDTLRKSLSNQISFYNDYLQKREDYDFVKVYYDEFKSGTNTKNRPAFNEMIEDCKAGKIDLILTKSISRFSRNTVDLLNSIRYLKSLGVEVQFEKEHISTMTSEGELILTLLAGFAQNESESISQNVIWGKRKRMADGIDQYHPLFGFDYKDGQYFINKDEAKVIKQVFKLFLDGLSYTDIANVINKTDVKTRNGYSWNQLSIKDILRQEKYMGDSLLQKRYVENPITHKAVRNKGELPQYYVKGTHPAIVDKATFEKAKDRIEYITNNKVKCHKQSKWFTGLVKCPICGRSMIKTNKDTLKCIGHYKYHTCENMELLKIKELEEFVKGVDLNKVDHIIYKRIRINSLKRGAKINRNVGKDDFEIVWKNNTNNK